FGEQGHMHHNDRFYDTIARFYDAENATYDDDVSLYEALLDDLGRESALVVGCGTGRVLLALARLGCRVTGIDLSAPMLARVEQHLTEDRKSTRLNSSHVKISYAVFCLKKKI